MSYHDESAYRAAQSARFLRIIALLISVLVAGIILLMLLWTPLTGPWARERQGMANLRQAKQDRQILVEQARGELQAAEAQAEAIRTMGEAARDFPEYRTQVFVAALTQALTSGQLERIVYIPVEANIPLTESGRFVQSE